MIQYRMHHRERNISSLHDSKNRLSTIDSIETLHKITNMVIMGQISIIIEINRYDVFTEKLKKNITYDLVYLSNDDNNNKKRRERHNKKRMKSRLNRYCFLLNHLF